MDTTNQDKPKPPKPTLFALWKQYDPDGSLLHTLANMANVSKSIVEKIFLHEPVTRVDAIKVIVALSTLTGETWTLSNMDIPLLDAGQVALIPTFRELCTIYRFDDTTLWMIAKRAGVSKSVVDVLYAGSPVAHDEAEQVLAALSLLAGNSWALDNTDISVINTEKGHP